MPAGLPCGMPGSGLAMEGAMQQAPQPGRQCGVGSEGGVAAMAHPEGRRASFTRRRSLGSPHQTSAHKTGFHDARLSSGPIPHVRISQMRARSRAASGSMSRSAAHEPRFQKTRFRKVRCRRAAAVFGPSASAPFGAARSRMLRCAAMPGRSRAAVSQARVGTVQ
ncbi:MAG: hypothetical protein E6Q50_14060 [Lysobacter sp.]|nr:MAG: hypothetical protein E6Q50_14060 [Lysobacter sp.]